MSDRDRCLCHYIAPEERARGRRCTLCHNYGPPCADCGDVERDACGLHEMFITSGGEHGHAFVASAEVSL